MLSWRDSHGGRRVADEAAVDFDIRAVGRRGHLQLGLGGGRQGGAGRGSCWRCRRRLELREIQLHVSIHVGGHLGALGNTDVFAMHEQEEWRGWKKHEAGRDDASGHGTRVASALDLTDGAKGGLLVVDEADVVDIDVEFAAARHSSFGLGLGNGGVGESALGDDEDVADEHFLQHFKVDSVSDVRVSRRDRAINPEFHRR